MGNSQDPSLPRICLPIGCVIAGLLLLSSTVCSLQAAKRKRKPSLSPTARAKRDYPAAKQAYADARLALYRAQHALSRALQDANKQADAERGQIDRSAFALALEEQRDAEKHVETLIERTREKLSKEDEAYMKAKAELEAAQAHYEQVSNADPPKPEAILEALNAIKEPSQAVGKIEQAALDANDYFQKAVQREEDAAAALEDERAGLANQLNDEGYDDATRQKLKDATAEVSKMRLALGEKAKTLSRISKILEPNNTITVGITKLNQNPKRKPKKRRGKKK